MLKTAGFPTGSRAVSQGSLSARPPGSQLASGRIATTATTLRAAMPNTCICQWNWSFFFWAIGTLTPTIAVGAAIWGATSWRRQQRATKRSEIAAEALTATLRLLAELDDVVAPVYLVRATEDQPSDDTPSEPRNAEADERALEADLTNRLVRFKPTERTFADAQTLARIHLEREVCTLLDEIAELTPSIWGTQFAFISRLRDATHAATFDEDALQRCKEVEAQIEVLRKKAVAVLSEIAQLKS